MTNAEKYIKEELVNTQGERFVYEYKEWLKKQKRFSSVDIDRQETLLSKFLCEQVKPTLTEDEKVILRHINRKEIDRIGKHQCGDLILLYKDGGFYMISKNFNYDDLFQFIQPRRRI